VARFGGITRFAQPDALRPVPAPAAPRSVAATARRAEGVRGGRRGLSRSVRAVTSPGCRRAACTPVARLRRGIASRWAVLAGSGCHDAHPAARCRRPVPPPAVWRRRPPAGGWGCAPGGRRPHGAEGAASRHFGVPPLHREADAQPTRARRGCAGRALPDARSPAARGLAQREFCTRRRLPVPAPARYSVTSGRRQTLYSYHVESELCSADCSIQ
jgi:hypothetical protein